MLTHHASGETEKLERFNDCPTVEISSAFTFHFSLKELKISTVGNAALREVVSSQKSCESHAPYYARP